jgi:hypothetical protein
MSPPVSISGIVKAEGKADLQRTRIRLSGIGVFPLEDPLSQPLAGNTEFTMPSVPQASYRVRVVGAPDGYYLKSVTLNGEDVTDKGLAVSSSIIGLEVTLAAGSQTISGVLLNANRQPGAGTVALAPAGSKLDHWDLYQSVAANDNGQFSFRSVPPGDYVLLGYSPNANVDRTQSPDYLRQMAPVATSISLKESAAPKPVEVKVVE